jgi:hypothetical protein
MTPVISKYKIEAAIMLPSEHENYSDIESDQGKVVRNLLILFHT